MKMACQFLEIQREKLRNQDNKVTKKMRNILKWIKLHLKNKSIKLFQPQAIKGMKKKRKKNHILSIQLNNKLDLNQLTQINTTWHLSMHPKLQLCTTLLSSLFAKLYRQITCSSPTKAVSQLKSSKRLDLYPICLKLFNKTLILIASDNSRILIVRENILTL